MRRLIVYLAAAALVWQSLSLVSEAQLVQVGPGYVKAPFVRVYHYPDGSSYVRAPFVAVISPGCRTVYPAPSLPTPGDLQRQLFCAAGELRHSLGDFATGGGWRDYLALSPGMALADGKPDDAQSSPSAAELSDVLKRFDSVDQNNDYRIIARLPGFKATHERLAAYLSQITTPSSQPEELPTPQRVGR